jgi:serine/threonine protein kinase
MKCGVTTLSALIIAVAIAAGMLRTEIMSCFKNSSFSTPTFPRMGLHSDLKNLDIIEIGNIKEAAPYALEIPESRLLRLGGSCTVYRIKNPYFAGQDQELPSNLTIGQAIIEDADPKYNGIHEYVACKKIALDEDWKVGAVKSEILALEDPTLKLNENAIRLKTVYHVDSEKGGTIYLITFPWVELSLQNLIEHLVEKPWRHNEPFDELAPWFQLETFEIWPGFLLGCLFFLLGLSDAHVYDVDLHFAPAETIDVAGDSIQVRGHELGGRMEDIILVEGVYQSVQVPEHETAERDDEAEETKFGVPLTPKLHTSPSEYGPEAHLIRHKDIKPDNILLWCYVFKPPQHAGPNDELDPLFVDFGNSKIHDPNATATYHAGSKLYRAPEQNPGQSNPGPPNMKSDVWSMGCCFTFIEAFIHSGPAGVKKIFDLTIKRDIAFRDCIDEINDYLATRPTTEFPEHSETMRRKFRRLVQTGMMQRDPSKRYNAYQVWYTWFKIMEEASVEDPIDVRIEKKIEEEREEMERERDAEELQSERMEMREGERQEEREEQNGQDDQD